MVITEDQHNWIENAIVKGFTSLQIKKKLQEGGYTDEKTKEMLDYYDNLAEKFVIEPTEKEKIKQENNEIEFEGKVKKFIENENNPDLTKKDKKEIKKFLKNITQYQKVLKNTIENIKKEIKNLMDNIEDIGRVVKEQEYLKRDLIERIIDSKEILAIEHPHTGEEVTKENLKTLSLNELIELMEENVEALQIVVNGKLE